MRKRSGATTTMSAVLARAVSLRYTRVSSDEQGKQGLSLDLQDTDTLRYSFDGEFLPGPLFSDVLTGKRDDRPGYQALLAEARRLRATGQPVVLIVWRLDRLGRHLIERARATEELTKLGIPIHSVKEGGVLPEFVANILAALAQEEIRVSSERITSTLQGAKARGWWPGGALPFGYRWRPRTEDEQRRGAPKQVLDLEPVQAEYMGEAYRQLAQGASLNSVHRWLANLSESDRGGRVMHVRSVRLMFQSPMYMGRTDDGVIGQWPAIIDFETWMKAQAGFRPRGATGRELAVRYLLSGFLECPECGSPMSGMRAPASKARPYVQTRYRCKADVYGRSCRYGVKAEAVESAVREQIVTLLTNYSETAQRQKIDAAWAREGTPQVIFNTERLVHQLQRDIAKYDEDIVNAGRLRVREELDQYTFDALRQDTWNKREAAQRKLAEIEAVPVVAATPELPDLDELLGSATTWTDAMTLSDVDAQRRILSLVVAKVIPQRVGWGKVSATIEWTPVGRRLMLPSPVAGEQVS